MPFHRELNWSVIGGLGPSGFRSADPPQRPKLNLRPLGYEHYDARLQRLGRSPFTVLASADLRLEIVSGLLRLPRLSPSRRVSCTNACTKPIPGLRFRSSNERDRTHSGSPPEPQQWPP